MAGPENEVSVHAERESPKKSYYTRNSSSNSVERHAKRQFDDPDEAKKIKRQKKETPKESRKRKTRGFILGGAQKIKRQKKETPKESRKRKTGGFILAEANDCDEDQDASEEGCNDLIDSGSEEDIGGNTRGIGLWQQGDVQALPDYQEQQYAEQPHLNRARQCDDAEEASIDTPEKKRIISKRDRLDYEENLEQRYGNQCAVSESEDSDDETIQDEVQQHSLLPHNGDPTLWMVKCRSGKEKAIALAMVRKFLVYEKTDKALNIKSIVAPESVKGYVYVEAYQQAHVEKLITLCRDLKMGRNNIKMVPILEMPEVLRDVKERPDVWKFQWVRPKRGLYKDDIGLINFVDQSQNLLELQLLPRIEYFRPDPGTRYLPRPRPDARRFDLEAVKAMDGEVHYEGDFLRFKGKRYCRQGFVYKTYAITAVEVKGVEPTLEELEIFSEFNAENFELPKLVFAPPIEHSFIVGDSVEVTTGELVSVCGTITKVYEDMITLMPNSDQPIQTAVTVKARMLKKCFRNGDHTTVLSGPHKGESGLIISIESSRIILLNDNTNEELEVNANDLTLYRKIVKSIGAVAKFRCGDVVKIGLSEAGVVVCLRPEYLHVLHMSDDVIKCKPTSLRKLHESDKVSGLDAHKKQIWIRDSVIVIKGIHTGRSADIKFLFRDRAFLYSGRDNKNSGFFVCKTKYVRLLTGEDFYNTSSYSSVSWGNRGSLNSYFQLRNKHFTITTGHYKGCVGILTKLIGEIAYVQLQQSLQTVLVYVSHIKPITYECGPGESSNSVNKTPPLHQPDGDETGAYKTHSAVESSYASKILLPPSSDVNANNGSSAYNAPSSPAFSGFAMSSPSSFFQTPSFNGCALEAETSVRGAYNSPTSDPSPSISGSEPTDVGWYACGLHVQISIHDHPDLVGQKGFISQLAPSGYCWIYLWKEGRVIHIPSKQLAPVAPQPGENFKVIAGGKKDFMGIVLRKSPSNDAAFDCQIGRELVTLPIENLCKRMADNFVRTRGG